MENNDYDELVGERIVSKDQRRPLYPAGYGDEKEANIVYKSRISDMDDESMYMEVPLQEGTGRLKKLYIGDELSAYF